jgi:hypothetical protein
VCVLHYYIENNCFFRDRIRVPLPLLTSDRRQELAKRARDMGEECRVVIRNIRRDGIEEVKKTEKNKEIGKDLSKKYQVTSFFTIFFLIDIDVNMSRKKFLQQPKKSQKASMH